MKKILLGVLILVLLPIKVKAEEPPTDEVPGCTKSLCESIGEEYNICPELLEAIAYHESRFTPKAKNGNHYGMMQVNVEVHKERLENHGWTKEDMYTPYRNLVIAAEYLAELYEEYEDNAVVLAMYSGNTKAAKSEKLCKYAEKVLEKSYEYETVHGKHKEGLRNDGDHAVEQ